jgi:hypothetical protein
MDETNFLFYGFSKLASLRDVASQQVSPFIHFSRASIICGTAEALLQVEFAGSLHCLPQQCIRGDS